jgi:putative phosphoesterase
MTRPGTLVGIISDTHALLRNEALVALRGCHIIVHAGDIGTPAVLEGLREIAPVVAIRGNNDKGTWASKLPETEVVEADGVFLYVLHNINDLALDPVAAGFQAVIAGHSHRPRIEDRQGVLFVNPGSAGPRRFRLPVTVARLRISWTKKIEAEVVDLTSWGAS